MYNPHNTQHPYKQISHKDLWEVVGRNYFIQGVFSCLGESESFNISISPKDSIILIMAAIQTKLISVGNVEIIQTNLPQPLDSLVKNLKLFDPLVLKGISYLQKGLKPEVVNAYYEGFGYLDLDRLLFSCFGRAISNFSFISVLLEDYRDVRSSVHKIAENKNALSKLYEQFDLDFKLTNGWAFKVSPPPFTASLEELP